MGKFLAAVAVICGMVMMGQSLVELPCSVENSKDGIYTFTVNSTSRIGTFNMFFVQHEITRLIPWAVTAVYNYLNNEHDVSRVDNFREYDCPGLNQTSCSTSYRMTPDHQSYSGKTSFDRGHLHPSHAFTYSRNANDKTFYCFNIAPQDPSTNQGPWNVLEGKVLSYFTNRAGYVITGVGDQEAIFSPTNTGYTVPNHYWKIVCYKDAQGATQVVGWIGNNTLSQANNPSEADERKRSTYLPRSQQDIMNTMNINKIHLFQEAWVGGETYLLEDRLEDRLPTADECWMKRDMSDAVRQEWASYIG